VSTLTKAATLRALALVRDGLTLTEAAKREGVSRRTLQAAVKAAGIALHSGRPAKEPK
jgi:predicted DNA-binding protein (UPF0251 family)